MKKETEQEIMYQLKLLIAFLTGVGFHDILQIIKRTLF